MATFNATAPAGFTTNMGGPGDGQTIKRVIRQYTLLAAMAIGDKIVGPKVQSGAIITNVYKVNGPACNIGTDSSASAFNTVPFTPYVVQNNEYVNLVATAAGGNAGDVVSIVVDYIPRNA
ncbi:hypothetical protein [Paraburkholderia caribensis]|uniref:hypothetical protein n=1 Tax=Paraburkholderia caribensis TaxID=75105 RepID=UPI0034D38F4F